MQVLRTPDEAFAAIADYPFAPHYAEVTDGDGTALRIHYIDEGPADAAPRAADAWRTELVVSLSQFCRRRWWPPGTASSRPI